MKWAFIVPGEPQPWMRAGSAQDGHRYTPKEMVAFQDKVRLCAKAAGLVPTIGTTFEVLVVAFLSVDPLSKFAGDWDNYAKNVCDALRGVAFRDDKQVVRGVGVKQRDEKNPRTEVMIRSVGEFIPVAERSRPIGSSGLSSAYIPPRSTT